MAWPYRILRRSKSGTDQRWGNARFAANRKRAFSVDRTEQDSPWITAVLHVNVELRLTRVETIHSHTHRIVAARHPTPTCQPQPAATRCCAQARPPLTTSAYPKGGRCTGAGQKCPAPLRPRRLAWHERRDPTLRCEALQREDRMELDRVRRDACLTVLEVEERHAGHGRFRAEPHGCACLRHLRDPRR